MLAASFAGAAAVTLLRIIEGSLTILLLALLISQVVVPALKGTRLFPLFDRRRRAAAEELIRARDDSEIEALRKQAEAEHRHPSGD